MAVFVPDPSFLSLLEQSEDVADILEEGADDVAALVPEFAPRDSGSYVENIRVERVTEDGKPRGRVIADDPTGAAGLIEFGTEDTPAFAPLRRALEERFGVSALTNDE